MLQALGCIETVNKTSKEMSKKTKSVLFLGLHGSFKQRCIIYKVPLVFFLKSMENIIYPHWNL